MRTAILTLLFVSSLASATDPFADVEIETVVVTDNIYMLVGAGGNIGVSNGKDGVLMVDDQYEPLADRIKAALKEINDEAPTFVLNTHYHGDHTGSNIVFGEDSIIMAHKNVRIRLINGDTQGNFPEHALPMVTYSEAASIHFNGEEVALIHTGHSHTDGDTMVRFTESDVIHMGDNLFNGMFPYIDLNAGGSVEGFIATTRSVIEMSSGDTKIIPGHGKLASRADLRRNLRMLTSTRDAVKAQIDSGMSLEEIVAAGVAEEFKGYSWGFINEERWLTTLYNDYK